MLQKGDIVEVYLRPAIVLGGPYRVKCVISQSAPYYKVIVGTNKVVVFYNRCFNKWLISSFNAEKHIEKYMESYEEPIT